MSLFCVHFEATLMKMLCKEIPFCYITSFPQTQERFMAAETGKYFERDMVHVAGTQMISISWISVINDYNIDNFMLKLLALTSLPY